MPSEARNTDGVQAARHGFEASGCDPELGGPLTQGRRVKGKGKQAAAGAQPRELGWKDAEKATIAGVKLSKMARYGRLQAGVMQIDAVYHFRLHQPLNIRRI